MSSGRRGGFCNDTNKWNTESPVPALIFRIGNYKKASKKNECVGRGWGRSICNFKKDKKLHVADGTGGFTL